MGEPPDQRPSPAPVYWRRPRAAVVHLLVGVVAGLAAGLAVGTVSDGWLVAATAGWLCGVAVSLLWTWAALLPLDGAQTAQHANREDPSRAVTDLVLLAAAAAALLGVALVLFRHARTGPVEVLVGVLAIAASWAAIHSTFTLRYARLHYSDADAQIDFPGTDSPSYHDFAYVAFTIGMTFQVSDTAMRGSPLRGVVLRHALLSYLVGAVVIAVAINLVAGIGANP